MFDADVVPGDRITGPFFPVTAVCAGLVAAGDSALSAVAPIGLSIGPRRCSRNAWHVKGNTTSPDAVTPMGIQSPGATLSEDGASAPVVCAEAAPMAASINTSKMRIIVARGIFEGLSED
jgi:hypothetical protein